MALKQTSGDWVDRLRAAVDARGKHSAVAAEAGIDASALSNILRRATDPKLETLIRLCHVCHVTVGWVLGESGFELGDADYAFLGQLSEWTMSKLEARNPQTMSAPHQVRRRSLFVKELTVAATPRATTEEMHDRDIPLEYQRVGANAVFRTHDDSMIDAGIFEGDVLFVRRTTNYHASNGQVIVGRLDGTFTVKRLRFEDNVISLFSHNKSDPEPITINQEEERFMLTGIVVGLQRDFVRR